MSDIRTVRANDRVTLFRALSPEAKEKFITLFVDALVEVPVPHDLVQELKEQLIGEGLTFEGD